MTEHKKITPDHNLQSTVTLEDLPPADTVRWVTARKAVVVNAVRSGLISLEDACRRYALSVEEFVCWQTLLDQHGISALRVTRVHQFRKTR